MYNLTLSKIEGGSRIRTDEVVGTSDSYPAIGESFRMMADPIVPGAMARMVTTSVVQNIIDKTDHILIHTMNSTYKLVFNQT